MQSDVLSVREGGSGGGGRREDGKKRRMGGGKAGKKELVPVPVFFETDTPLQSEENPTRFKHIAGLHSELVAVDTSGALWRWAWHSADLEPHPLISELGLSGESVKYISGRQLRVTVVTESGKVRLPVCCCLSLDCTCVCVCRWLAGWTAVSLQW